jgi:hypothetical protein
MVKFSFVDDGLMFLVKIPLASAAVCGLPSFLLPP